MRTLIAMTMAVALSAGGALAQETSAPAVPPSACPAFTPAPDAPDAASATADQMRAAVQGFEAWRVQTQATLDCRSAEVTSLNAQSEARTNEYRAAQADNAARAAAFQAQLDAFRARMGRR